MVETTWQRLFPAADPPSFAIEATGGTGDQLIVEFSGELGVSPDPLLEVGWSSSPSNGVEDFAPLGGIEFAPAAAAVPEPNSVILLVTLVGMVGFLTRRKLVVGGFSKRAPDPTA